MIMLIKSKLKFNFFFWFQFGWEWRTIQCTTFSQGNNAFYLLINSSFLHVAITRNRIELVTDLEIIAAANRFERKEAKWGGQVVQNSRYTNIFYILNLFGTRSNSVRWDEVAAEPTFFTRERFHLRILHCLAIQKKNCSEKFDMKKIKTNVIIMSELFEKVDVFAFFVVWDYQLWCWTLVKENFNLELFPPKWLRASNSFSSVLKFLHSRYFYFKACGDIKLCQNLMRQQQLALLRFPPTRSRSQLIHGWVAIGWIGIWHVKQWKTL